MEPSIKSKIAELLIDNPKIKIGLDLIDRPLTNRKYSHSAGWARFRAFQISDDIGIPIRVLDSGDSWDDYDVMFIYHGAHFTGVINLFLGATDEVAKSFERLLNHNCTILSLDIPMPDYGKLCDYRKLRSDYWSGVDWEAVSIACNNVKGFYDNPVSDSLTMGDSHTAAAFRRHSRIIRNDGRTLRGVLRKTLKQEITDCFKDYNFKHITFYYGNIDVRHHIMREDDPIAALDLLMVEYEKQIKSLKLNSVEVVGLLPIEPASRHIPKTGLYDNTPFFGTVEERSELVRYFNETMLLICSNNNWEFYAWPQVWYDISPEDYMNTFMERPRSVHLSPEYHRENYWPETYSDLINF